jgi:hypothetical protein
MRQRLLLEALPKIGQIDGSEGAAAIAAAERQNQMIERADCFEASSKAGEIGGIHGDRGDIAVEAFRRRAQFCCVAAGDRNPIALFEKVGGGRKANAGRAADDDGVLG